MQEVTRSTVAKLLANENISVVQDNVRTAMFDVKNRVLTLPMWSDVAPYTEDHLIGHEVGHALYTPLEGWHDAVCSKGSAYKSYLNVIEDARIEKLIQRKYPGLRAPFIKSYKKLLADGFFGADVDTINNMTLIDRINVYFKCGQTVGVKFTMDEQVWLPRIADAETWEEVVAIADELYQYQMELNEEQRQDDGEDGDDDFDTDDTDGSDGDADGEGEFEDGESDYSDDGDLDDDLDEEGEGEMMRSEDGGRSGGPREVVSESQTDKILRDSIDREIFDNFDGEVYNLKLHDGRDYLDRIVPVRAIVDELNGVKFIGDRTDHYEFPDNHAEAVSTANGVYDRWFAANKNSVNHMVKEFEMRKSAAEYARASVSKTGVIDTVKMNNYRLSDDIFKRVTTIPEGKNHGFIMYLDMSGSMGNHMYNTIEQTLLLALFCRQIKVPFRVYGFNDMIGHRFYSGEQKDKEVGSINPTRGMYLMELFNEKMSKSDVKTIAGAMLAYYGIYTPPKQYNTDILGSRYGLRRCAYSWRCLDLGGTPLDDCIAYAMPLAVDFRAAHRIDVLNTVFLTDGCSHSLEFADSDTVNYGAYRRSVDYVVRQRKTFVQVTCPHNNKTYKLQPINGDTYGYSFTDHLLRMYKEVTGSVVIGYRIENGTQRDMQWCYRRLMHMDFIPDWDDKWKQLRTEGWAKVDTYAYDECYVLNNKSLAPVNVSLDDVDAGASKSRVRSAFRKATGGSRKSRKMLTDLMERVA